MIPGLFGEFGFSEKLFPVMVQVWAQKWNAVFNMGKKNERGCHIIKQY